MILYTYPSSPFGCKVNAVILACGLEKEVQTEAFHPWQPDHWFRKFNPLGKIPVLVDNHQTIFDSPVICEYLMDKAGKAVQFMPDRFKSLKIQALVDGMNDAAVSIRYEKYFRPINLQCVDWYERQLLALTSGLEYLETRLDEHLSFEVLFENLCVASMLSYLEVRFADAGFSNSYKKLYGWYNQFMKHHPFLEAAKVKDYPAPPGIMRLQK